MVSEKPEAQIVQTNNILLVLSKLEHAELVRDFCGIVISVDASSQLPSLAGKAVYICGDLAKTGEIKHELKTAACVFVIEELADNFDEQPWPVVGVGRVPILVHGVGVLYRQFFDPRLDYFNLIRQEHAFQSLTESNKPAKAHRTGIYLTPVERRGDELHFRLLRCSSNLSGPTGNFRATDRHIVDALNIEAKRVFVHSAPLNHVLAQIYWNTPATETHKQTKAKIKGHADKTKDMPKNSVMAFCTFYDGLDRLRPLTTDTFDYGYRGTSGLTTLYFRLKQSVANQPGSTLKPHFRVTLYPNSVFLMPLSTNRLYTHEIRPSQLDVAKLPTRLGYVVRCSAREAVYKQGQTYLEAAEGRVALQPPTPEGMAALRKLYAEENCTDACVDYGDGFLFSMNRGDYTEPHYDMADEFRRYRVRNEQNPYDALLEAVVFEDVAKGRQGNVLVDPDDVRGIPIVRTTTQYRCPAQRFQTVHMHLAQQIQTIASLPLAFNNALIEHYSHAYTKMGFHSDQALDLADGSYIAVYSCYQYPELADPPRKLIVESKEPGGGMFEVPLTHNSVVVFSLDTNRRFKHKIVLDRSGADNHWLGITFRTSKTFVQPRGEQMTFEDGTPLTLASDDQRREFFKLRGRENRETSFAYPRLTFSLSESDLRMPVT